MDNNIILKKTLFPHGGTFIELYVDQTGNKKNYLSFLKGQEHNGREIKFAYHH